MSQNFLKRLKRKLRSLISGPAIRPDLVCSYKVLGTEYGGWPIVDGTLDAQAIVYSFGVGEDISFDLALITQTRCSIWAFDPTPKSRSWVESQSLPPEFHFEAVGISAQDGEMTFYPPANENYVSFSAAPGKDQTRTPITAPVRRLKTITTQNGHDHIDVLKMDVEGFEYDVIADLLAGDIRPGHVLVEFHHGMYGIAPNKTKAAVANLRAAGYRLFYVSDTGREYGFFRPGAGDTAA